MSRAKNRQSPHSKWTREEYLVDALARYEEMATKATTSKSWVAAVKAKNAARLVRAELDQLRETERQASSLPDPATHRQELLHAIRKLRIGAQQAGSYVAAANLIGQESTALVALEDERRQAEIDRMMQTDLGSIISEVTQMISTLPETLLEEIERAIEERRSPPPPEDDEDDEGEE